MTILDELAHFTFLLSKYKMFFQFFFNILLARTIGFFNIFLVNLDVCCTVMSGTC